MSTIRYPWGLKKIVDAFISSYNEVLSIYINKLTKYFPHQSLSASIIFYLVLTFLMICVLWSFFLTSIFHINTFFTIIRNPLWTSKWNCFCASSPTYVKVVRRHLRIEVRHSAKSLPQSTFAMLLNAPCFGDGGCIVFRVGEERIRQ